MGWEGANVIFDDWVHPLMMGLEEHLIGMFRDDFEFNDDHAPSHLGGEGALTTTLSENTSSAANENITWADDAQLELKKIPFFVRGKARRNTESFAVERGVREITLDTLYDAKAHFSR